MKISRQELADAAMVSVDVVRKAEKSGRVDIENAVSIAGYIVLGRISSGGLSSMNGASPEPAVRSGVENFPVSETVEAQSELPLWSGTEIVVLRAIEASGKTRKQAEAQVRKMREAVCAERLGEEHLEELGL